MTSWKRRCPRRIPPFPPPRSTPVLRLWNHFTGDGEVSPDGRELAGDPDTVKTCAAAFEAA
jgi:hypothetical protein